MATTLTRRQLNRTLLQRQMLLERQTLSALDATEILFGLQSQVANPPYIALWARLDETYQRDDLTQAQQEQRIVRVPFWRSTLHLLTTQDVIAYRTTVQPALDKALSSFFGRNLKGVDYEAVVDAARPFLREAPRTTGDLKGYLGERFPDVDEFSLTYVVRALETLVTIYPYGTWRTGGAQQYQRIEDYLDIAAVDPQERLREVFLRYLGAFGPASLMDFQFFVGMTRLKKAVNSFRDAVVTYKSESGEELFDLPDTILPDPATPAPIRFTPEYDNLVIAHRDRSRVLADADYKQVFRSAARVFATVLIDGFVAGVWKATRENETAVLSVDLFRPKEITPAQRADLEREGEAALRFIEDDALTYTLRYESV